MTDNVNGPWEKAADGHWWKQPAKPFQRLTALV